MRTVLITQKDSAYAAAILHQAKRSRFQFDAILEITLSVGEKLHLARMVTLRGGLWGLPFYLQQRQWEARHLHQLIRKQTEESTHAPHTPTPHSSLGQNSRQTLSVLEKLKPDLLVLGSMGILQQPILDIPRLGTLNAHPAVLPCYRGYVDPGLLVLDDRLDCMGCSVHWVTRQVDGGNILQTARYQGLRPDNLAILLAEIRWLCATKLIENTIQMAGMKTPPHGTPQNFSDGKMCRLLPVSIRKKAEEKFQQLPLDCFQVSRKS